MQRGGGGFSEESELVVFFVLLCVTSGLILVACITISTVLLPSPLLIWTSKRKLIWTLVRDYASI